MISYLLTVSLCLLAFLLVHEGLLKYNTFFRMNRYYLLFGMVASFVIPHITLPGTIQSYDFFLVDTHSMETDWIGSTELIAAGKSAANENTGINYSRLLSIIYFAGSAFLLLRLLFSVARYVRLIIASDGTYTDGIRMIRTRLSDPVTFFNVIILPDHTVNPAIVTHEKVHVKQYHWIDLLFVELTGIVLWFNPVVPLYRKAIKLQHEYLADALTIESGVSVEDYLHCLLNQIEFKVSPVLTNKFSSLPFKNRIVMITKNKTPMKYGRAYLLLIPAICLLLLAFSNKQEPPHLTAMNKSNQPVSAEQNITTGNKPSKAPVEMAKAKITALYGQRKHPVTGKDQLHRGIDFELAEGEIVMSAASGTVLKSAHDDWRGNYIIIKHDDVYSTSYLHLKSSKVKAGEHVDAEKTIGYVGTTGMVSGNPHLHYEVIKNGEPVDPKEYLPVK